MKRKYVYDETVTKVNMFVKQHNLKTPNYKDNFPFSLQQYINHLEFLSNNQKSVER